MAEQFLKDPAAVIDYSIDWATDYLVAGENITDSNWSIVPQNMANDLSLSGVPSLLAGVATAFVADGVPGRIYQLSNHITTDQGRLDDRSILIRIEEK